VLLFPARRKVGNRDGLTDRDFLEGNGAKNGRRFSPTLLRPGVRGGG
jgi:hypothetical protein